MEILYVTFNHLFQFVNSQMAAMSKCSVYVLRELKYYLHDKLPNESIISRLGNAKMLNPFAPGDFAEKHILKLVEWFSGHCRAIKS